MSSNGQGVTAKATGLGKAVLPSQLELTASVVNVLT